MNELTDGELAVLLEIITAPYGHNGEPEQAFMFDIGMAGLKLKARKAKKSRDLAKKAADAQKAADEAKAVADRAALEVA